MKIQKKIFITILMTSILFGLLTIPNYAANETSNTKNTNTQTSTNTGASKNTSTSNTTTTKSSNANLSDLGITPHDFTGFKYGTTYYEVTVPKATTTVEVYAKTQDTKATITGTGKKTLEEGENKVEVVVTAEDGTKKTYTINIIRGAKEDKDTNEVDVNEENSNGLSELKINDLALSPEFKTNVYEYTVKYIGEDTKLNIEANPTDEDYVVEVIGNNDLQEGENIITILVSESNGENVATYQVTVNKSLVDEEAIAREEAERKEMQQKIIIGVVGGVILIAIIVLIIVRHKRNKNLAEEFSGAYFYDNHNDDEDEKEEDGRNEEVPRALKKKKSQERDGKEQEYDEDEIEKMPKEKLKEKFLNNYSNYEEEYEVKPKETKRTGKHKGKRFK